MSKETPCIAVCMIDPRTSLCFGCGRTLPEIARWHRMDSAERQAVMAQLPARMAEAGLRADGRQPQKPTEAPSCHGRRAVSRFLLVLLMLAATAGAVVAYGSGTARARQRHRLRHAAQARRAPARAVQIARGQGGEFALQARINGVNAPMVIDTGATSVVLT